MADRVRAHVFVSGDVQGVFFRQETSSRARTRGVAGWVRNLPDGRVEAVFEGSQENVDSMIRWCKEGPRFASVSAVEVEWEEPSGDSGFTIR
jgi:acylphosphatase